MLFTQQIIHSLPRIKGTQRPFNKNSVPDPHCAVPQARKLQCYQFSSVLSFIRDKT